MLSRETDIASERSDSSADERRSDGEREEDIVLDLSVDLEELDLYLLCLSSRCLASIIIAWWILEKRKQTSWNPLSTVQVSARQKENREKRKMAWS